MRQDLKGREWKNIPVCTSCETCWGKGGLETGGVASQWSMCTNQLVIVGINLGGFWQLILSRARRKFLEENGSWINEYMRKTHVSVGIYKPICPRPESWVNNRQFCFFIQALQSPFSHCWVWGPVVLCMVQAAPYQGIIIRRGSSLSLSVDYISFQVFFLKVLVKVSFLIFNWPYSP